MRAGLSRRFGFRLFLASLREFLASVLALLPSVIPVSIFCSLRVPAVRVLCSMRTSFFCLLVLAGLTTGLRAQIPNTWTQEKLKKVYDVPATIAYTKADIKSIAFTKKGPGVVSWG
jgi:hypothetical protein